MGKGGKSPSPNDDRSRSMNPQDPVGQAAMANEARQSGDDDYGDWDDESSSGPVTKITDEVDKSHWGVYRDEEPEEDSIVLEDGYDWKALKAKSKPSDE